jgi:hypothetical protein
MIYIRRPRLGSARSSILPQYIAVYSQDIVLNCDTLLSLSSINSPPPWCRGLKSYGPWLSSRVLIDPPPLFHCKLYLRGSVSWEGVGPGLPRRSLFASPLVCVPLGYSAVSCAWFSFLGRCGPWVTPLVYVSFPPLCVPIGYSLNCAWCRCLRSCGPWATRSKSGRQCVNPSGTRPVPTGG